MDKSFTSWRQPLISEDSDNDSDIENNSEIVLSSSHNSVFVPDSDESFISKKNRDSGKKCQDFVPDSDDQITSDEDQSLPQYGLPKSHRSQSFVPDSDDEITSDKDQSLSQHGLPKSHRSQDFVPDSDDETTSDKDQSLPQYGLPKSHRKSRKSKNDSYSSSTAASTPKSFSKEESNPEKSVEETAGSISVAKEKSGTDGNSSNNFTISVSESDESTTKDNQVSHTSSSNSIPKIDLTQLPGGNEGNNAENLFRFRHRQIKKKGAILISSDSEEDQLSHSQTQSEKKQSGNEEELSAHLKKVSISRPDVINPLKENKISLTTSTSASHSSTENDYSSRLESLTAEQVKLDVQVKEVLKNIETIKSTLRTANLATLPDKGVRLQVNLKRFESQLRDLRYQQGVLSNQIIKLQLSSNSGSLPKPIQSQPPQQKMYKLPTTMTDINAMGKKALETHRTQQALTVDALRSLHNSLKNCPSEGTLSEDPQGLKVELMPHQKYALSWLLWREREKPSGGILADDMGLGKTLTMISLVLKSNEEKKDSETSDDSGTEESEPSSSNWLSARRSKLVPGKTLVVCPASLLGQWEGEAQRRVKRGLLDVVAHHGPNREKKSRRLARLDIVITTYTIVSRDNDQPESPLFQIKWERVILDEAHQIRNHKSKTAQAVCRLKARSRWALTGTPVQNKELDLFSLIKFLRCVPFDDLAVWKTWVDNRDVAGQQRRNTIMKSLMLRRTKKGLQEEGELKSLPEKECNIVLIKMDNQEAAAYEKLVNFSTALFAQFLHQKAEKENALQGLPMKPHNLKMAEDPFKDHPELARLHRKMKEVTDVKSHHILTLILRLRQFCCHPSLIQSMLEKDEIASGGIEDADGLDIDLMDKMTRMSIGGSVPQDDEGEKQDLTALDKDNPLFSKDRISSKLKKVVEKVEEISQNGDKLLVVSQWVSHLNLVEAALHNKNIRCLRLTGEVAVKDREEIVSKLNRKDHGPRVLLLSLTAGGVGLNLVGANHLLLLDLHWNPQLENQACDRIYRVGQEKNVHIHKFVTSDTVEESVLKLQATKLQVADSVLTGVKTSSKLTLDDLKTLFNLK